MQGRLYDGLSSRPATVEIEWSDDGLRFASDAGEARFWPQDGLKVVREGDQARLSHPSDPDARLVLAEADWIALGGSVAVEKRGRIREARLVIGLAAVGLSVTAFVFWGVPVFAGPLARATPIEMEQKMGDSFDAQMGAMFHRCEGEAGQDALGDLGERLAARSDTPFDVRVRAVQAPFVNAFALPGGSILVTDDLIREAETPDELAAVVAHEVAHIEKRHVMQAVWRSLGVGLLLDAVVGGGTGAGQQAVLLAGQATDLRYGREAELEADQRGQALLVGAGLSSQGMAPFFERMHGAGEDRRLEAAAEFVSTHPDSARRAQRARNDAKPGASALTPSEWAAVRASCGAGSKDPVTRLKDRLRRRGDDAPVDQGDQMGQDRQASRRP
ncbi:M48 family metallopeptidase [Brevundimonas sp.]|uniref:M48 family metallopeptidase n=1 Tax=Brevundimonas sp. TaxID=1871086 RepID=UPI003D6D419F